VEHHTQIYGAGEKMESIILCIKKAFEGQQQQIIEVAHVDTPEKESTSTDGDDVAEDEEMEEASATDDEDFIEECDETSNLFSEIKDKKIGKLQLY
jgi:hypothetical protein